MDKEKDNESPWRTNVTTSRFVRDILPNKLRIVSIEGSRSPVLSPTISAEQEKNRWKHKSSKIEKEEKTYPRQMQQKIKKLGYKIVRK